MKLLYFANTDWYLWNFRRSLALAARDAGHDVLLVSPPGPYAARFAALGLRWLPAPMQRRSLNPLRELGLLRWLHALMRTERVDLVHAFTIKGAVYGSLAARLAGVPARVNAVTGLGYVFTSETWRARLLRPVVRALLRLALGGRGGRLVLQNMDDVRRFADMQLVTGDRVHLIEGSGVDCRRFAPGPSSAAHTEGEPLRVLLPARLLWDKGVAEFVTAAARLAAEGRAIRCLLAGTPDPGNPASVPEATVHAWVRDGLVTWLGHVDDMPALLREVDVAVLPSYREGLPRALIEAAACGLPLVTTDVPGCRAVVTHEVDGLLVPVRDPEALTRAIARLHDEPALRARLGAAARAKALRVFDERHVIARTLAVYRDLLPSPRLEARVGMAVPA